MANPVNIALYGHRSQLWLKNTTTGSEIVSDRIQSIDPSFALRSEPYFEIGRKGKIGTTQNPPEFRIAFDQNLVNSFETEWVMAGKSLTPVGIQTYNLGDILTYASKLTAYVLNRNQDDTIMNELEFNACSVAEMAWRFTMGGAIVTNYQMIGAGGKHYLAANVVHPSWGGLDNASLGGIHGKEARIYFTSGSTATGRAFRLQNFNLRAAFPNVYAREIGNRALVGTLADAPEVTIDFDLLLADDQPADKFFTLQTTFYDYTNPTSAFNAFVRVFDPRDTEGLTVLREWKIENVKAVQNTPVRAQVRGLATARYSLVMSQEATVDSGGLILSNQNSL